MLRCAAIPRSRAWRKIAGCDKTVNPRLSEGCDQLEQQEFRRQRSTRFQVIVSPEVINLRLCIITHWLVIICKFVLLIKFYWRRLLCVSSFYCLPSSHCSHSEHRPPKLAQHLPCYRETQSRRVLPSLICRNIT